MMIAKTAELIARRAHEGQYRRDGVTPYVAHPERVVKRVAGDDFAEAVAWLHDVLEDTEENRETLLGAGIPEEVVVAVEALTKVEGLEYEAYLLRVRANPLARTVKIQDMLDNLSDGPSDKQILKYARGLLILHGESH